MNRQVLAFIAICGACSFTWPVAGAGQPAATRVIVSDADGPLKGALVSVCLVPQPCLDSETSATGETAFEGSGTRTALVSIANEGFAPWSMAVPPRVQQLEARMRALSDLLPEGLSLSGLVRPAQFPAASVEIQLKSDNSGPGVSAETVSVILGSGAGWRLRRVGSSVARCELSATPQDVAELLTVFYQNRFFDLRSEYSSTPSLVVDPDGQSFSESTRITSDMGEPRLSLSLGSVSHEVVLRSGAEMPAVHSLLAAVRQFVEKHCGPEHSP